MHLRLGFSALSLVEVLFLFLTGNVLGASINDPAWEKIVAVGKKEGKVVVFGPPGPDVRDAFTLGFQKRYPVIEVDFSGMQGAQVAPKLVAELKVYGNRGQGR